MGKKTWIALAIIIGSLLLIIAFIPNILSTSSGKALVERIISKKLGGKVDIDDVHLTWSGPQTFKGVSYVKKTLTISCESVISDSSLFTENHTALVENGKITHKQDHHPETTLLVTTATLKRGAISMTGSSTYGGHKGDFEINCTFSETKTGIIEQIKCDGVLDNVPVAPIDALIFLEKPKWQGAFENIVGAIIHGHFDLTYGPQTFACHTDLHTPNLALMLNTIPDGDKIALTPTSKITWHLGKEKLPHIDSDLTLEITGKDLELTPSDKKWSLASLSGDVIANLTPITVDDGIHLNGTTLTLSTKEGTSSLFATLGTRIAYGKTAAAPFHASLTLADVFDPLLSIRSHTFFQNVNISTTQFPLPLIDTLLQNGGLYTKYFGSTLNFSFEPHKTNGKELIYCHIHTPRLTIDDMNFHIEELARLKKPVRFSYAPPQNLGNGTTIGNTDGTLSELAFPLSPWGGNLKSTFFKTDINPAYCTYDEKDLSLSVQNPTISLTGNGFKHIEGKSTFTLNISAAKPIVQNLLGPTVRCSCDSIFDLSNFESISAPRLDIKMINSRLDAHFDGAMKDNFKTYLIESPFQVNLQPPSPVVNTLLAKDNKEINYLMPAPLSIVFEPTLFTLHAPEIASLSINADLTLPELQVTDKQNKLLYTIVNTKGKCTTTEQSKTASFTGYSEIIDGENVAGKLNIDFSTTDYTSLDFDKINLTGTLTCQKFSSKAADHLLGISPFFLPLAGDHFNLKTTFYQTHPAYDFNVNFDSFRLFLSGHFVNDETFHLFSPSTPCKISGELNAKGFETLLSRIGD
ncbi:MAG: hypothetical protein P0S94_03290, partial [Simkaniaceae bacterium]|nr:hypothetical protein [Simkaniaceae bacterium]